MVAFGSPHMDRVFSILTKVLHHLTYIEKMKITHCPSQVITLHPSMKTKLAILG